MAGGVDLPRITDAPYFLTLHPYAFFWLRLQREATSITLRPAPPPDLEPDEAPLFVGPEWWTLFDGSIRHLLETTRLARFLKRQSWFVTRPAALTRVVVKDWGVLASGDEPVFLIVLSAAFADGHAADYALPVVATPGDRAEEIARHTPDAVIARLAGARKGVLHARLDGAAGRRLLRMISGRDELSLHHGRLRGSRLATFERLALPERIEDLAPAPFDDEQFRSSAAFGERLLLKNVRRLWPGPSPEREVAEWLAEGQESARLPALIGVVEYVGPSSAPATVALAHAYVPNQRDGWRHAIDDLGRFFDAALTHGEAPAATHDLAALWNAGVPAAAKETVGGYLTSAAVLGRRAAELHALFAGDRATRAFGTGVLDRDGITRLGVRATAAWDRARAALTAVAPEAQSAAQALLARHEQIVTTIGAATDTRVAGARLIRTHGTLDLAHTLIYEGDFSFIGFAGSATRSIEWRRELRSPLEDVATMMKSFHAAASRDARAALRRAPQQGDRLSAWARCWTAWTVASFCAAYREAVTSTAFLPADNDAIVNLLRLFLIEQAADQIEESAAGHPAWLPVPIGAVTDALR